MGYTFLDDNYLILPKNIPENDEFIQLYKRYDIRPTIKLTNEEFEERFGRSDQEQSDIVTIIPGELHKKVEKEEKNKELSAALKKYYLWSQEIIRILDVFTSTQNYSLDNIAALLHKIIAEIKTGSKYILYLEHMVTPNIENKLHAHIAETSLKTTILVVFYAIQMRLSYHQFVDLAMGAMLHNIGLLNIPQSVIFKGRDLTENDKKQIALVPAHGYQIAKSLNCSPIVCRIVLQSREFVDGSGYPLGLQESQISNEAKIVAVCSSFASMTSKRTYRKGYTSHEAMVAIMHQVNKQLAYSVIHDFVRTISIFPLGSMVELEGNRYGLVVEVDNTTPRAPFVAVYIDKDSYLPKATTIMTRSDANKIKGLAPPEIREQLSKRLIPTVKEFMAH